jgi:integrator complex subunit 1
MCGISLILLLHFSLWLLRQLPLLPHFHSVRPQVVQALRQACQVENDPALVSSYIYFLAVHTRHDSLPDLADLVLVSWLLRTQ